MPEKKEEVPEFPDLKSCKCYKFYSQAQIKLKLSNKNWCGNIKKRFKVANKHDDYIHDAMLKGYWSKKNSRQATFQDAQNFCQSLGKEWSLPTAYQLISLISPDFDSDQGYIAPIFSDNDQENFWSSSREAGETNTWYISFEAGIIDQINPIFSTQKLQSRCFRPE